MKTKDKKKLKSLNCFKRRKNDYIKFSSLKETCNKSFISFCKYHRL